MGEPANEALGAGPIAAPTATPMASIPAAKAALARSEGRRGARWKGVAATTGWTPSPPIGEPESGAPAAFAAPSVASGGVGVSGGVLMGLGRWTGAASS